ncbi:MAG: hypothetical protein EOM87_07820, partial [Clostridia bacterium]|nr:hypothetical protein [Clostridia bacterium]
MTTDVIGLSNLNSIYEDIFNCTRTKPRTVFFSVAAAQRVHIAANMRRKLLYITDAENIEKVNEAFTQLNVKTAALYPQYDLLLHRNGTSMAVVQERISALSAWVRGLADVMIITPEVLRQYLPYKKSFEAGIIELKEGGEISIDALSDKLIEGGYRKSIRAEEKGTFAVLGDIFEVFPLCGYELFHQEANWKRKGVS